MQKYDTEVGVDLSQCYVSDASVVTVQQTDIYSNLEKAMVGRAGRAWESRVEKISLSRAKVDAIVSIVGT